MIKASTEYALVSPSHVVVANGSARAMRSEATKRNKAAGVKVTMDNMRGGRLYSVYLSPGSVVGEVCN